MAYTIADAYCSMADIEAILGRGALTGATIPTSDECMQKAVERAGEIRARAAVVGYTLGAAPLSTAAGDDFTIERLARQANAYLAAGDASVAHGIRDYPNTENAVTAGEKLWEEGRRILDDVLIPFLARLATAAGTSQLVATPRGFTHEFTIDQLKHVSTMEH